jgi:hypothetical protein
METARTIESSLVDVTGIGLGRLRESRDQALEAGLRRLVRLVTTPDHRFGGGDRERSRLD